MSDESNDSYDIDPEYDPLIPVPADTHLAKDWRELAERYSQEGIQISQSPHDELSSGQIEKILEAYERSQTAGKRKVREHIKGILERQKTSIDQTLDSLVEDFEDAELRNSDERTKPLSREAKRKAKQLGKNVDLLKEYLSVSFQKLAAVTGMSRSSLHKITRKGRVPKITTLYQIGIGMGVPPRILLADSETFRSLARLADLRGIGHKLDPEEQESTTGKMDDVLYGDPEKGDKDPGIWLDNMVEITGEVARHLEKSKGYRGASNATILSAVIGRHHQGEYGAFLAAHVAHQMHHELEYENLGGFSFPSEYLRGRIEKRMRETGITLNR